MTSLDRMLHSKNAVLAFGGLIAAITAWTVFKDDGIFPAMKDPKGDPEKWSIEELKYWLEIRNLHPSSGTTRNELLERVKLNMAPKNT